MNTTVIDADQVRELATWLEAQTWSNFALSLANHYRAHGSLTEKQLASAKSMFEKSQAREALRTRVAQLPELAIGTYIQPDKSLMWIIRKAKGSDNTYAMNKAFLGKTWTYVRNGKATLSNLVNIGQAHVLVQLAPGHVINPALIQLDIDNRLVHRFWPVLNNQPIFG